MRASGLLELAVCLSSLAPLTAASWPGWLPERDALVVRVDKSSDKASAGATATDSSAAATKTDGLNTATTANLNTAKVETGTDTATGTGTATGTATGTETGKKKGSKTTSKDKSNTKATHTTYSANDPAGGVSMQTPNSVALPTPLYKIGDYVTLGWNYTSLQGTPTAIDILVSCSTASETWTLTSNMTFETSVEYVWDTEQQATAVESPLLVDMYTLIIKDSDAGITEVADPGYLGAYTQFTFGMYTGQPYTPLPEWTCAGCNAANAQMERQALGMLVAMGFVTVASFTWFVTGLGLQ